MTEAVQKRRHPMIVFAGGVIAPGLGFWLSGRLAPALLTAALATAAIILVPLMSVDGVVGNVDRLPSILVVVSAAIRFGAAAIAAYLAFRDGPRVYRSFEHPWWAAGFILVTFVSSGALRDRVVSPRVAAFAFGCVVGDRSTDSVGIAECASPDDARQRSTMVVIVKRGFRGDALAVNDVVAVAPKSASWSGEQPGVTRVIAVAGSTVSVNGDDGVVTVDGFPVIAAPCDANTPHFGRPCTLEKQATPSGARARTITRTSFPRGFETTSVGKGQVFVLPDDRGRQMNAPAGLVAISDIEGTVVVAQ